MTQDHKPHMTLPNGDRIYEGGYGRTRDGRKVGPMALGRDALHTSYMWAEDETHEGAWCETGDYGLTKSLDGDDSDLIAEWTDEPVPTPDYNDGNWHGWNGGECPVHPKSTVAAVLFDTSNDTRPFDYFNGPLTDAGKISPECWRHGPAHRAVIAFRVVKPYTAPREWWIVGDCEAYASEAEALEACKALYGNPAPVHVREVTE